MDKQILSHLVQYKTPGVEGIASVMLQCCADLLVPHLGPLYCAMFMLKTYPECWKKSVMVMLRKPAKLDYTVPNTHRPPSCSLTWWPRYCPLVWQSVKKGFSYLTKEKIGQDKCRKDVMNDHQEKALKEGCHEREWVRIGVSSTEKTNTK